MKKLPTTAQRSEILRRLRKAGIYDMQTITFMYRRLDVPEELIGRPLDKLLDMLSRELATDLIDKLKQEHPE